MKLGRFISLLFLSLLALEVLAQEYPISSLVYVQDSHPGGEVVVENVSGFTCDLFAVPASGYQFLQWADGSTSNPRSYTQPENEDADCTLYAVFVRTADLQYTGGTVSVSVDNPSIPSFILTAIPNGAYDFYKWDNGVSTTSVYYAETEGRRYPFFSSDIGSLTFDFVQHPGGVVSVNNVDGPNCTLIATPNSGYSFLQWADGNTQNPRPHTHNGSESVDETLYAVFTRDADMTAQGGHISVGVNNPSIPSFTLTATPDSEADFYKWDNGVTVATVNYIESDGRRYPFFTTSVGILTFDFVQHPGGVVSVNNVDGLNCSLIATPNNGYRFQQWADGNTQNPRAYTHAGNASVDETVHAVFTRTQDVMQMDGTTTVEVANATIPTFTLTATEASCASFVRWFSGEEESVLAYKESDGTKIPIFTYGDHQILLEYDNNEGGDVIVTPYTCGFTLTAEPSPTWHFSHWTDDASIPATRDVEYIAETYTAVFSLSAFKVGDEYYPTFATAESAAVTNGLPIVLVDDVLEDIVITQNIQIDGNGYVLNNLYIPKGKKLSLVANLQVNNLYIEATTGSASQLEHVEYLTCANAYMDITFEAGEPVASPDKWYAISVPFEVDVETGIRRQNAPTVPCVSATDYLVWEYDGTLRASTGNGWRKMLGGTLYPGRFYMIGIDGTQNTWRFARKSGSAMGGSGTMDLPPYMGSEIDGGWNAVANPTLQYVTASIPDIPFVQVYDNKMSRYLPLMTAATSFVVACPFFVQVDAAKTMILTASNETNPNNLYTPKRYSTLEQALYEVHLSQGDDYDVLFVSADDDASYSYEVGKDVLKMGFNSNRLQLFTMLNNGNMLCVENRPFVNGAADFPIYILAPQAGDYTLSVSDGARAVYLLENGMPIANITGSEYTLRLQRGMTTNYALRIGEKQGITTDVTPVTEEIGVQKIILDNQLYIIHNQNVYNATGVLMR